MLDWVLFGIFTGVATLGCIIAMCAGSPDTSTEFEYNEMPKLEPIENTTTNPTRIVRTKFDKCFSQGRWVVSEDFYFWLNGEEYVIPKGFATDCVSVPRICETCVSSTGMYLMGSIVHDYAYMYAVLLRANKHSTSKQLSRNDADKLLRDVNYKYNGSCVLNTVTYYMVRIGGYNLWNLYREKNYSALEDIHYNL